MVAGSPVAGGPTAGRPAAGGPVAGSLDRPRGLTAGRIGKIQARGRSASATRSARRTASTRRAHFPPTQPGDRGPSGGPGAGRGALHAALVQLADEDPLIRTRVAPDGATSVAALRRGAEGGHRRHAGAAGTASWPGSRPVKWSTWSTRRGWAQAVEYITERSSSPPSGCGSSRAKGFSTGWRWSWARCRSRSTGRSRRPYAARWSRAGTAGRSPTPRSPSRTADSSAGRAARPATSGDSRPWC